jgi:uncharacterized membrane protein
MSDNLSPRVSAEDENEKTFIVVLHALYLASAITGVTSIIGLVMAYVKRDDAQEWSVSHYQYAIRTFWIGLLYGFISLVLCFVLIGFFMLFAVYVWFIVRSVMPIIKAMNMQPVENPTTWWI